MPTTAFLVGLLTAVQAVVAEDWNAAAAREAIKARNDRLGNLIAQYEITTTYAAPKPTIRQAGQRILVTAGGVECERREFSILGKLSRYEADPIAVEGQTAPDFGRGRSVATYSPERSERLTLGPDGRPLTGTIDNPLTLPPADMEAGIGLRAFGSRERMNSKAFDSLNLQLGADGYVVMKATRGRRITDEWVADPARGYAIRSYRRVITEGGGVDFEVIAEDVRSVKGVLLPHLLTIKQNYISPQGDGSTWKVSKILVKEYKVDAPDNSSERYSLKWPEGTTVIDKRSGLVFGVRKGEKAIDDQRIYEEAVRHLQGMEEPASSPASSPATTASSPRRNMTAQEETARPLSLRAKRIAWRRRNAPGNREQRHRERQ
ncbi:MAG: hypothetical protein NT031_01155 [Planctomycetota bacterium]|nr:hypothetical protein [Planctomycetota bacterium]